MRSLVAGGRAATVITSEDIAAALATKGYYEVSAGSLDDGDLITAFMAALGKLQPGRARKIEADPAFTWIFARLSADGTLGCLDPADQADVDYFLWEYLWTDLVNAAPAGCVFGQSPSNASLFMFTREELVDEA